MNFQITSPTLKWFKRCIPLYFCLLAKEISDYYISYFKNGFKSQTAGRHFRN